MGDSENTEFKVSLKHLGWAAALIVFTWAATGTFLYNWNPNNDYGTFGDMFGAVNALFSGLAFACLIFATLMQREELKLQRKELQLARREAAATREEIKGQREQAVVQNQTLKKQQFENTFFEFVRLLRSTAADLHSPFDSLAVGQRAFENLVDAATSELYSYPTKNLESIRESYNRRRRTIEIAANSYFRTLAGTLGLIQISEIENKQFYADILNATLSNSELVLTMLFVEEYAVSPSLQASLRIACQEFSMFSSVDLPDVLLSLKDSFSNSAGDQDDGYSPPFDPNV
jgi:Putative phage abortive infection protein